MFLLSPVDHLMKQNIEKKEAEISLERLQAGDQAEFARLVDAYSPQVYRLALKILNDPQDAEDVLQETFLKALRAVVHFEGRSSLSTWLYRIAVNEALMTLRRHKGGTVSIDEDKEDEEGQSEPVEIIDWCCLPEKDLLSAEARLSLDRAIETLSPALRAVFVLRDIQGLSVKETADALEVSEAVVKTRLLRARLKLREELSVYYAERLAEKTDQ
jgi:RNA polymerase sigma-70 factor, ECF subfamily